MQEPKSYDEEIKKLQQHIRLLNSKLEMLETSHLKHMIDHKRHETK